MQRYAAGLLLNAVLLIALSGCGARPPANPPAPVAVKEPAGSQAPPDPANPCRVPNGELPHALESAIADLEPGALKEWAESLRGSAPCLSVTFYESDEDPTLLLVSRFSKEGDTGAVLWLEGDRWRSAAAPLYQRISVMRHIPEHGEYLVGTWIDGTGGYGRLVVLRKQGLAAGGMRTVYASDTYDHFGFEILDNDNVVLFGRDTGGAPMATSANCCVPGIVQQLVVRSGDVFAETAKRQVPSPHYSLDVFIGALRAGDESWLQRVAVPAAVAAARSLHLENPQLVWNSDIPDDLVDVERHHWSEVPAELKGPLPTVTEVRATASLDETPVATVTLNRIEGDWRVTQVSAK